MASCSNNDGQDDVKAETGKEMKDKCPSLRLVSDCNYWYDGNALNRAYYGEDDEQYLECKFEIVLPYIPENSNEVSCTVCIEYENGETPDPKHWFKKRVMCITDAGVGNKFQRNGLNNFTVQIGKSNIEIIDFSEEKDASVNLYDDSESSKSTSNGKVYFAECTLQFKIYETSASHDYKQFRLKISSHNLECYTQGVLVSC